MTFKVSGIKNTSNEDQSPREKWESQHKAFKIKFILIFVFSHLLWLLMSLDKEQEESFPREAPINENHAIVHLPAWNYGDVPNIGKKNEISLIGPRSHQMINGYLRGLKEDPLGQTGTKAILEIPKKDLVEIKNTQGPWSIYPSLNDSFSHQSTKAPYEISW